MDIPRKIADQIVNTGRPPAPDLVKVDVQVRTGGGILPPSWLVRSSDDGEPAEPDVKKGRGR